MNGLGEDGNKYGISWQFKQANRSSSLPDDRITVQAGKTSPMPFDRKEIGLPVGRVAFRFQDQNSATKKEDMNGQTEPSHRVSQSRHHSLLTLLPIWLSPDYHLQWRLQTKTKKHPFHRLRLLLHSRWPSSVFSFRNRRSRSRQICSIMSPVFFHLCTYY